MTAPRFRPGATHSYEGHTIDASYIQARITATKAQIEAYEDAVLAVVTPGVQSYSLDTGQTRQTVTKLDLADLQTSLDALYNRCATLEARLNGSGVTNVRPGW